MISTRLIHVIHSQKLKVTSERLAYVRVNHLTPIF
jgi:hypothetical protein